MKAKRELPVIKIMGTEFIVDVEKEELRQKGNESNTISWVHLNYKKPFYYFSYDEVAKRFSDKWPHHPTVQIKEFIQIDPVGMALKYDVPVRGIKQRNDYDLRINQRIYGERVMHEILPVIYIAGNRYIIELEKKRLNGIESGCKNISLKGKWDCYSGFYHIYYDPNRKVEVSLKYCKGNLSNGVLKVVMPGDHILDPVAVAYRECHDLRDYLMKNPMRQRMNAQEIVLDELGLAKEELRVKEVQKLNDFFDNSLIKKNTNAKDKGQGKQL